MTYMHSYEVGTLHFTCLINPFVLYTQTNETDEMKFETSTTIQQPDSEVAGEQLVKDERASEQSNVSLQNNNCSHHIHAFILNCNITIDIHY